MPVRLGGSWLLDPVTGELTPNLPDDQAGEMNSEAQAGGRAEGQQAEPEPIAGAPTSDEPVATMTDQAPASASETGEASGADPAAASDANNDTDRHEATNTEDR